MTRSPAGSALPKRAGPCDPSPHDLMRTRVSRILVVEDETVVAHSLRATLGRNGYDVVGVAATSEAALELAGDADLVLMDLRLGEEMGGIAAAGAIRERFRVPVVFLTANSDAATLDRAWAAEPYGYLIKPIDQRDLKPTIEFALCRHEMDQERERLMGELRAALAEVEILRALIPICAWCKKVRDDEGYWEEIDEYLEKHFHASYTHSICPSCVATLNRGTSGEM